MSRRSEVNAYLEGHGINLPKAPRYYINKNGNERYYEPYRNCSNGSCRPWFEFAEENDEEELLVLYVANHVRTVMGWSLHHIWPYDDAGTNNISNLILMPKKLNSYFGNRCFSLEAINEEIQGKNDHWRSWYEVPENYSAVTLETGLLEAERWVKDETIERFLSRAIYR